MNAALLKALDRFSQITGNLDGWASIDDILELCDSAGFWTDDFLSEARDKAKKATIRRLIKSIKGDDGVPEWASVVIADEAGQPQRIYKQEMLFDVADYRQVVQYHVGLSEYHRETAQSYAKRCKKRFNVQLRLPFAK